MLILLARVPDGTTEDDVLDFLDPVLKGGFFVRKGLVESIEIVWVPNGLSGKIDSHCVVRISPESAGQRVIKKLNRKSINGKHIAVREYFIRNWHNDRRLASNRLQTGSDRRRFERRRSGIRELRKVGEDE